MVIDVCDFWQNMHFPNGMDFAIKVTTLTDEINEGVNLLELFCILTPTNK